MSHAEAQRRRAFGKSVLPRCAFSAPPRLRVRIPSIASLIAAALLGMSGLIAAQDELEKRATWSIPTTAEVKGRLDDYLSTKKLDEAAKLKIEALWPDEALPLDGGELLDRLTASMAVVEPKATE